MGEEVSEELDVKSDQDDTELLRNFTLLPKMFSGRALTVEFVSTGAFKAAYPEASRALGLEIGATVFDRVKFTNGGDERVFAQRDVALTLCKLPIGAVIQAQAVTAFGVYDRVDYADDPVTTPETETGLVLKKILNIQKRTIKKRQRHGT
jgi:hypothetical protein